VKTLNLIGWIKCWKQKLNCKIVKSFVIACWFKDMDVEVRPASVNTLTSLKGDFRMPNGNWAENKYMY
jgi:hypothetical protein